MKTGAIKTILAAVILLMLLSLAACKPTGGMSQGGTAQPSPPTVEIPEAEGGSGGQAELMPEDGDIGIARAQEIALARVPGAVESDITSFERDYDDGFLNYEGEIRYGGMEYEFEIDAATGEIIGWEIDD